MLSKVTRLSRSFAIDVGESRSVIWAAVVNGLAGSHSVSAIGRTVIYRLAGMRVDRSARIRPSVIIRSPRLSIGPLSTVNYGCIFDNRQGVSIGSRVGIGVGVLFINSDHDTRDPRARAGAGRSARIVVHDGVFVGSGATILSGVELAQGCVIAAGAVVKESTLPHGLYVGVPARRIKDLPVVFD